MSNHMLTRAQLNAHVMLREAIKACQPEYVLNWIMVELTDDIRIRGSELEKFGDLCARAGHMKGRK